MSGTPQASLSILRRIAPTVTPTSPRVLHLLANRASGQGAGADLEALAAALCAARGARLQMHPVATPRDLEEAAAAAERAALADGGVVVAAGGDGTIRSVAQVLTGSEVPLAVVPVGTFNFFARNHHIPEDPRAALALALDGEPRPVDLGEVNGHVFLINASLGLYARAIAEREQSTARFGRKRLVVIASTLMSFLKGHPAVKLEIEAGGHTRRLRTPMVFIGNNALQLRDVALDVAGCMQQGRLAVVVMRPVGTLGMLRMTLNGLMRMLGEEENLLSFCADSLVIRRRHWKMTVALDGELFRLATPLSIHRSTGALRLVQPTAAAPP